jgi:type VI secretion system protein ImpF
MAKGFEPSLLDKLFDDAPREQATGILRRMSSEEFKDSVARDVEALLNNRSVLPDDVLKNFPHCQRSLASYGIHDFSSRSLASSVDRAYICRSIETAIARHEPRLTHLRVSLSQEERTTGALRFSISALLVVHPSREPINFDAMLQPSTLQYSVHRNRRAAAV